jgi:MAE_28990/MAE_18760-like HEPN
MSIRTVENLYDHLSDEIAWRRKELTDVKALIETKSFTTSKRDALIRAGVALLYAHWEGFIKAAATAYLEFVSMQRMRYDELSPNFIAISVKGKLNEAAGANKASVHTKVVEFFLNNLSDRCTIPFKTVVNTKANLSSTVLQNILAMLGLDYTFYETKEKLIDEKLLASRNTIAHGSYLLITIEDYIELHEQITEMMNHFRNDIDNSATLNRFKRP